MSPSGEFVNPPVIANELVGTVWNMSL